ncbi:hypothetical protein MC885_015910, partial [Smutsia gigantea]
ALTPSGLCLVEVRRPFGYSRRVKGQETPTKIQAGSRRPEHALRVCAAGPGRRRCLESGLGEDLGGTAALGGGGDGGGGGERGREGSVSSWSQCSPGAPRESVPAPMSPRRASPTVPRREWGTQSSADDRRCFARGDRMW